ncbi:MAG: hypothetical protein ACLRZG_07650 [Streptococcus sp.]
MLTDQIVSQILPMCEDDLELVESNVIETANTESWLLLDAEFMFDGAINIVQSEQEIAQYKSG